MLWKQAGMQAKALSPLCGQSSLPLLTNKYKATLEIEEV